MTKTALLLLATHILLAPPASAQESYAGLPPKVADQYSTMPYAGQLYLRFRTWYGWTTEVPGEIWGQVCNENAAARGAVKHLVQGLNSGTFVGWRCRFLVDGREIEGGVAADFDEIAQEHCQRYVQSWRRELSEWGPDHHYTRGSLAQITKGYCAGVLPADWRQQL